MSSGKSNSGKSNSGKSSSGKEVTRTTTRRDFLRAGVGSVVGASALVSAACSKRKPHAETRDRERPRQDSQQSTRPQLRQPRDQAPDAASPNGSSMPQRQLGKTGRLLPILGFGGAPLVAQWARSFYHVKPVPEAVQLQLVRHAFERGIRYFDTGRSYDLGESVFGRALKDVRRHVYLATKVHTTDPHQVRESVETSLQHLRTDHVDCVQIHSPCIEAVGFGGAMKIHAELLKLKDEGLVRFIGLTTHIAFEVALKMIRTGGFDQALLAHGYFRRGADTLLSPLSVKLRDECLAAAHSRGMGLIAMKVLGATVLGCNAGKVVPQFDRTRLARLPGAAIRWATQDQRLSILNIGACTTAEIDENVATLQGDLTLTATDQQLLKEFCLKAYRSPVIQTMLVH